MENIVTIASVIKNKLSLRPVRGLVLVNKNVFKD
jgi:hypothetical protein